MDRRPPGGPAAEAEVVGTLEGGRMVARATVERLLCDAAVVAVRDDSRGNAVEIGRRRRTIPTTLRRALRLRDRGCRFPGCTNRFVDGHHVVPWAQGGPTTLDNLCSLCRRHHTYVHEGGVRILSDAPGQFAFFRSDGRPIDVTGAVFVLGCGLNALRSRHQDAGLTIDATTNAPRAERRADYDLAVWTLMRRQDQVCTAVGRARQERSSLVP